MSTDHAAKMRIANDLYRALLTRDWDCSTGA
jgi:hypothetical protein